MTKQAKAVYDKKYRLAHKSQRKVCHARYLVKLKADVVRLYGGGCTCCGETEPDFLTLEHTNGDGGIERKVLGLKGNRQIYINIRRSGKPSSHYTILCWNCNCAIGIRGRCPHALSKM